MSDSVRPHRRQPTRLPHPWDSPGKNTGVGCHFLLQCMKVKSESEVVQSCPTQRPHGLQPTRLLCPWDFPGKSTGVGCHCLLQKEVEATLKQALTQALALRLPDPKKAFQFYVHEREEIALGVLTQRLGSEPQPVAYLSKRLDPTTRGWPPCL